MSEQQMTFIHVQLLVDGVGVESYIPKRQYHKSKLTEITASLAEKLEAVS